MRRDLPDVREHRAGGTEAPEPALSAEAPPRPLTPPALTPRGVDAAGGRGNQLGRRRRAVPAPPVAADAARERRRRGSRGGRKRSKPVTDGTATGADGPTRQRSTAPRRSVPWRARPRRRPLRAEPPAPAGDADADDRLPELPDRHREGRPASVEAADKALVRKAPPLGAPAKPEIGDTTRRRRAADRGAAPSRPGTAAASGAGAGGAAAGDSAAPVASRAAGSAHRGRRSPTIPSSSTTRRSSAAGPRAQGPPGRPLPDVRARQRPRPPRSRCSRAGRSSSTTCPARPTTSPRSTATSTWAGCRTCCRAWRRRSSTSARPRTPCSTGATSTTTPRTSRRGHDGGAGLRIEQMLQAGQTILCQVTKNPIGAKGARLTQEVSLPGRFVVLIPNTTTYGISKRLPDDERKRLRRILDRVKPAEHGLIVRTAAEGVTAEEIERRRAPAARASGSRSTPWPSGRKAPALLYREPDMAVRVIREEFNQDYRGVVIDDRDLYEEVRDYVGVDQPRAGRPGRVLRPRGRGRCRCSSGTTCTSSCTRPSTARSGCRRAAR